MSSRIIGKMCVRKKNTNKMISSSATWKFTPIFITFALLLPLLSGANGEGPDPDGAVSFTPSLANANLSPGAKSSSSSHQCDPPKSLNSKVTVFCKQYTTIPTDIPDNQDIQVLDMSEGNSLQELEDGELHRANLPSLNKLNLQNCRIYKIERGAFRGENVIQELDLSYNKIETLDPIVFSDLTTLRFLYIKENPINRFQLDAIFPPLQLTSLDLSNGQLDNVPVDVFQNLPNLEKLSLQGNKLRRLDWRVFNQTTRLHTLDLTGNPWHCDCHVWFLIDTLRDHPNPLSPTVRATTCASTPSHSTPSLTTTRSLAGINWESILREEFTCRPEIAKINVLNYNVLPPATRTRGDDYDYNNDHHDQDDKNVELGQDVYFECEYSGYPRPEVKWLKDNKPIVIGAESGRAMPPPAPATLSPSGANKTHPDNLHDSSSSPEQKAKFEVQDGTFNLNPNLERNLNDQEQKRNYKFRENLILRRVEAKDQGNYECYVSNPAGYIHKTVFLNLTRALGDEYLTGGGHKKGVAVWMWILVAVLILLISVLLILLVCLAWKRKEKKKQEGFRKVVQEKFKDSNVDLGDLVNMKTTSPVQQKSPNSSEGARSPLLENGSEHSTVLISELHQQSQLPDVAQGNADLLRNSQIYSPKPPPALHGYPATTDSRREFFARQISEPYLRPVSSMSLQRPIGVNAAQRRYIFANQHYPTAPVQGEYSDQEHQYAVPAQIRTLPRFGSAVSMSALGQAENDMRRQMFLRQNPQPQPPYATAMRPYPHRRTPSTSSESQIDNNHMMGAFTYSTLPRRPIRLQSWSRPVSPTGSTCSSYSTLSWRPMQNPVTGTISDGVGPRTNALGGSTNSLNRTPDLTPGSIIGVNGGGGLESMSRAMNTPTHPGKVKSTGRNLPRLGHSRTPSSLTRGHNDFFSFEPIPEVESSVSNLNLEKMNGQQPPNEYSTQSLARGEPRYTKRKPPPIAFNPATLKEPSRAFDHLKGRSVSPAANRNGSTEKVPYHKSNPTIVEVIKKDNNNANSGDDAFDVLNDISRNIQVPIMESTIDEVPTREKNSSIVPASNRLSKSGLVPPPPPPKPKRSPNDNEGVEVPNSQNDLNKLENESEMQIPFNDGTVV